jgi:hypothetical protein
VWEGEFLPELCILKEPRGETGGVKYVHGGLSGLYRKAWEWKETPIGNAKTPIRAAISA